MTTIHGGRNPYKHFVMLARIKQWCILNPGKKALLTGMTGLQVLTYDAGSKVFIYSSVKVVEPTINKELYLNGTWDLTKESKLK